MKLLAVDPGITCPAAAVFDLDTKTLVAAKRFPNGASFENGGLFVSLDMADRIARFSSVFAPYGAAVLEWPQIYRVRGKKDPNDLLPLAALDGQILARLSPQMPTGANCKLYQPHEWKGSKKANPTARMVISRLSNAEKSAVEDLADFEEALTRAELAGKDVSHPCHNTIDAVGIGLKYLRRLERHRVIAR